MNLDTCCGGSSVKSTLRRVTARRRMGRVGVSVVLRSRGGRSG